MGGSSPVLLELKDTTRVFNSISMCSLVKLYRPLRNILHQPSVLKTDALCSFQESPVFVTRLHGLHSRRQYSLYTPQWESQTSYGC